jgi:hypothetical protein
MRSQGTSALLSGGAAPRHRPRVGLVALLLMLLAGHALADDSKSVYREPPGTQPREITRLGIEMVPVNAGFQLVASSAGTSVSCPAGQPFSFIETWMAPPHGVQLLGFDFVGKDLSVQDQAMFAFRVCQSPINDPSPSAQTTSLGSVNGGNPLTGSFAVTLDLTANNEIVDAVNCRYLLRTRLSSQNQVCVGTDMALHKLVMRYRNVN